MPSMNELNEAVYRGKFDDQMSKGADAAKKAMSALGDAVVTTDEKVKRAERTFGQMERRYDESARRAAAMARATREYESAVKAATSAVEAGARTQEQADEVIRRAVLIRDAAFAKAEAQAEKQRTLYTQLEQLAGRNSMAYQKWAEATRVATQAQERFNQQLGIRVSNQADYEKRSADIAAYGRGLDELRARISPLHAAELRFLDSVSEVNEALKVGAINMNQAQLATERYRVSLEATARAATAASQARFNQLAGITLPDDANSASRAADIQAYGRALNDLRAQLNPVYAAELQFERAQEEVNLALKAGAISAREARVAVSDYANTLRTAQQAAAQLAQTRFNELAGITLPDDQKSMNRAADMEALGRSMDATRAKYVPLVAVMQRYEQEMREVREAEKLGILTTKEAVAARQTLTNNYTQALTASEKTVEAHSRAGRQVALTSQQLVQLSYQMNDVIAQSAVGTNPMIILAQQGPQVAQALGGWTASLRMLTAAITPATAAAALLVAAIVIPVSVANSNEARLSSMRNALRAYREDYRQTAEFLNGETRRIALASPGFGLGDVTDSAKTIERARVVSQLTTPLAELVQLAQDLSKTLDGDLASASERVARAMRDPAAVAKELSEQGFPGVTEALRRQIEVLQRAGERQQAFTLLQSAMNEQLRGAARDVSPLTAAWQSLTKTFAEFWEMMRPGLEVIGAGIITWVRTFFGYMTAIRDIIRDISSAVNNPAHAASNGGAWNSPAGGPVATTLQEAIGRLESGNRYDNTSNPFGYMGRYQFGGQALEQIGMYTRTERERRDGTNSWGGTWNYPGVNSVADFVATPGAQDEAFRRYMGYLEGALDGIIAKLAREGIRIDENTRINGLPYNREAMLGMAWARPADMEALLRGQTGGMDGNRVTSLQRYGMFYRQAPGTEQYGPFLPDGQQGATVSARGQIQAEIDEAVRRARGEYGSNQQSGTRQNAAADMTLFARSRQDLERMNEALREQQAQLEPTSAAWQELQTRITSNNDQIQVLNNGMDGARAAMRSTLDPVQELIRGWERQAEEARDAGSGAAFVRDRLRQLDETSMRYRGTSASVEEQQRATSLALSELSEQYRNATAAVDRQIASNNRVAAAAAQGAAAMSQQEAVERAREEVRKTTLAGTSAEAEAVAALARRYVELQTAETERATARRTVDRAQELEYIQREVDLIGASVDRRERELAALKERQAILRADPNADLNSDINRRAVAAAEGLAVARVEADRLQSSFNELAQFGARAFDRIGSAITEAFANGTMSTIKWGNIARAVLSEMIQMAIKLALINPLMNWAFGQNNPTIVSAVQSTGSMFQGNALGTGGSSGLLGQAQQLSSLYRMFSGSSGGGGSSWLGSAGAYLNNPIWTAAGGWFGPSMAASTSTLSSASAAMPMFIPAETASMWGAMGGAANAGTGTFASLGAASIGSYAAGIGGGYLIGSEIGKMVAKTEAQRTNSQIGAGGGAVAGAIAGTLIAPGIGTVIGGLIGGALGGGGGGLIGPSNEFKGGDVGIGVGPDGKLMITGAGGKRWNESAARQSTQEMLDPINQLLNASGVRIEGAGGFDWDRGSGGLTLGFNGTGGSFNTMGPSELWERVRGSLRSDNQVMQSLIDQPWMRSWEDLNATGGFALSGNANLNTALRSGGIRSRDDVGAAYNFITGIYEPLTKAEEQVSSWQQRIKSIHDTFLPAIETATRYGLATEVLTQRMNEAVALFHEEHNAMMKTISDSLAVRKLTAAAALEDDPVKKLQLSRQAALVEFDNTAKQQRKELETTLKDLYVNVWNPAQFNQLLLEQDQVSAQERLALWKQYEDQIKQIEEQRLEEEKQKLQNAQTSLIGVIQGLYDYASGLRSGDMSPLSPMGRLEAAQSQFDEVYQLARTGDFKSLSRLTGVSDQYLSLAREVYGGGIGYSQIFDEIVQALDEVTAVDEDTLTASAMAAIMQSVEENLSEKLEEVRDMIARLYTETRQNNLAPTGAP